MRLFSGCKGTCPKDRGLRQEGKGAFLSVTRMPSKTIAGLMLFMFAASVALLPALAVVQQSRKSLGSVSSRYSLQDVRLLNAEEINRRTLALAAEINASPK